MIHPDDLLARIRAIVRDELAAARSECVPVATAATMLGCGTTTVYELLKTGDLERGTKAGRRTMITVESVSRYQRRASEKSQTAEKLRAALQGGRRRGARV